jgi:DNA invertase Pin-like site-specific DNA recombinase
VLLVGYARVSKSDGSQSMAPQRDALLEAGVAPERVHEDLACGRDDARPGLVACLKALQPGNTLVVWKLDRLGRDLRHLVNTVEDLRGRPDRHHHRQWPPGLRHLRRIRARPHR